MKWRTYEVGPDIQTRELGFCFLGLQTFGVHNVEQEICVANLLREFLDNAQIRSSRT